MRPRTPAGQRIDRQIDRQCTALPEEKGRGNGERGQEGRKPGEGRDKRDGRALAQKDGGGKGGGEDDLLNVGLRRG